MPIASGTPISPEIQPILLLGVSVSFITASAALRHQCTCRSSIARSPSSRQLAAGSTMMATNSEQMMAAEMTTARSPNSCPASSWRKNTGRKIATVVAVDATSAPQTWPAPRSAASKPSRPCSRWRTMFSSTTIAASSTMPVANASPAIEITFSDMPSPSSTMNEKHRHSGIARATIMVAR